VAPGELSSHGIGVQRDHEGQAGARANRLHARHLLDLPDDPLLLAFVRPHAADVAHVHVPPADRPRWRSRLQQLAAELEAGAPGYAGAARALLILLLTDTARLAAPQLAAYTPTTRPLLTRVFRYIEAHYAEPISLREVAAAVGHSPAYLTDLVRRATGRTVLSWIMERRMAEARYLLLETDQAVGQVAAALGYRRASHFIAHFRRLHGATPQVWRREQHAPRRKITV
jgi:AraC-like DNA-binding protein